MKLIAITFLFAVALTLVTAEEESTNECRGADDCEKGECCRIRKHDVLGFRRGFCTKLGEKGDACSHEEEFGRYLADCPCVDGLTCKPFEVVDHTNDITWIKEKCTDGTTNEPEDTTATAESQEATGE